jgi:hypothetical protein
MPDRFARVPRLEKPINIGRIATALSVAIHA